MNAMPLLLLGAAALFLMSKGGDDEEEAIGGTGSDGERRPYFGKHNEWSYTLKPGDDGGLEVWNLVITNPDGDVLVVDDESEWSEAGFDEAQDTAKRIIDEAASAAAME